MFKRKYLLVVVIVLVAMLFGLFNVMAGNMGFNEALSSNQKTEIEQQLGPAVSLRAEEGEQELYAVVTGGKQDRALEMTLDTLGYLHYSYRTYRTLEEIPAESRESIRAVIVTTNRWETAFNREEMQEYLAEGGAVVFEQLPNARFLKSKQYFDLLGIQKIGTKREQESVRFYDNMLLCDQIYKDVGLIAYDVELVQSCRVFAHEFLMPADGHWPEWNEAVHFNPLIWRNYWKSGQVQVMNGNFMNEAYGMGILAGVLSEMEKITIMPVVGANIFSVADMPVFHQFDEEFFREEYFRSSERTIQEVVWPSFIALSVQCDMPVTGYWSAGIPGSPMGEALNRQQVGFWLKEFTKYQFEMGIGAYGDEPAYGGRTREMADRIREYFPGFTPRTYLTEQVGDGLADSLEAAETFRSVVRRYDPDSRFELRFLSPELLQLPVVSDGFGLTDRDRLVLDSVASAFGYVHTQVDMRSFYGQMTWSDFSKEISKQAAYARSMFPWLPAVKVSEGAALASRYLCGDPQMEWTQEGIVVTCQQPGLSFILRSEYPVSLVEGGTLEEIKPDVYLLTMEQAQMNIEFRGV